MADKKIDVTYSENARSIDIEADESGGVSSGKHIKVIYDVGVDPAVIIDALQRAKERIAQGIS